MRCIIKNPALLGDMASLYSVANAMATCKANAGDCFNRAAFDGALKRYAASLAYAARNRQLVTSNQEGISMPPDELIATARQTGHIIECDGDDDLTFATNVFVSLQALNKWGAESGNTFETEAVPWLDENGWNGLNGKPPPTLDFKVDEVPIAKPEQTGVLEVAGDGTAQLTIAQLPDSAEPNWKMRIQSEATALCLRLRKSGANPTRRSILGPMAEWCVKNKVKTDGNIIPSAGYLRTHVLGGKHWDVPN